MGLVRRQGDYNEARKVFTKTAKSPLDWPEMLWEAWLSFEHSHGSAKEVQNALDVIERARTQVEARRAKVLLTFFSRGSLTNVDYHTVGGRAGGLPNYASHGSATGREHTSL